MDKYFKDISQIKILTPKNELELAKKAKSGNEKARKALIVHNLRYVVEVAKSYQGQGLPLEDLVAEGNLGICKAVDRFDPTRGMKFITYAVWWIRQSILQALSENPRVVRIPINKINEIRSARAREDQNLQKTGGFREEKNYNLDEYMHMYTSYPVRVTSTTKTDQPILELFIDKESVPPDESLKNDSLRIDLETILENLNAREAEILRLYHGMDEFRAFTLEEIGNIIGLTRERVRQIKKKALRKLRKNNKHDTIRHYLG
jgi:RNA polymerase primary sigma factor